MRIKSMILVLCLICAATLGKAQSSSDNESITAFIKSLPDIKATDYNETERLALAANPLGCEEHPHAGGGGGFGGRAGQYLWIRDDKPTIADDYAHHRAFYGCLDWHSAVNSTWMMASLIKNDPTISVAPAIRSEFDYHLQKSNFDGEMNFFTHLQGAGADFEKPYGYAWVLKLYAELKTWNDPEGQRAAAAMEPMAEWFKKAFIDYLNSLNYPVRIGLHPNTALDMNFVLDGTDETHDQDLIAAIHTNALRLFKDDKHCPVTSEPVFNDFASPCLTEAALMGRVLSPEEYAKWLTDFLPPVYSEDFKVYSNDVDALHGSNRDTTGTDEEGVPNAHLIGLNLQRAGCLMWISKSLPKDDPRAAAYLKLADVTGRRGYSKIGLGGYLGTHWLSTYALIYENLVTGVAGPK